jgi:hypothetical protein
MRRGGKGGRGGDDDDDDEEEEEEEDLAMMTSCSGSEGCASRSRGGVVMVAVEAAALFSGDL